MPIRTRVVVCCRKGLALLCSSLKPRDQRAGSSLSKKLYDEDDQRGQAFVSEGARTAYLSRSCSGHAVRFVLGGETLAVPWPDIY
jgi:hypothetical protein